MILNSVFCALPRSDAPRTALLARGVALFLGAFTLLNLAGDLRARGFDLNLWWIDLRVLPGYVADPVLFLCGLLLAWFALHPAGSQPRRMATAICVAVLLLAALGNCRTCLLLQMPYNMAREVVAIWAYYLRPLA